MPHFKIIERAEIVSVQYDMSAKSQALLAVLTSKIHPETTDLSSVAYHVSEEEAKRYLVPSNSKRKDFSSVFQEAKDELRSTVIQMRVFDSATNRYHVTESSWISEVSWAEEKDGVMSQSDGFTVTFPPTVHRYLSGIKMAKGIDGDRYISTDLLIATSMRDSKYSQRFYKMVKNLALQVVSGHKASIEIELKLSDLKASFRLPSSYRPSMIVDRIVKPSIKEICKVSDLSLELVEVIKKGKTTTGVKVLVSSNLDYTPSIPPREIITSNVPPDWSKEQHELLVYMTLTLQLPDKDCRRWISEIPYLDALKGKLDKIQTAIHKNKISDAKAYYITALNEFHDVIT